MTEENRKIRKQFVNKLNGDLYNLSRSPSISEGEEEVHNTHSFDLDDNDHLEENQEIENIPPL
ncbi:MAG TPA: hypothetical protein DCG69_06465 [Bacteroidales bacterium]|nr:hypothetical protein [Bacteroidales bacterium]